MNLKTQAERLRNQDAKIGLLTNDVQTQMTGGTTSSSTMVGHCKAIFTNDGLPLYMPFDYSSNETTNFSSMSYVCNKDIQEIEEVKEVKKDPTPHELPIVNHNVAPYEPPIPFTRHLEQHVEEELVSKTTQS
ncbi:hypothetical protein Tco_0762425 [Tanacetum coccineum]